MILLERTNIPDWCFASEFSGCVRTMSEIPASLIMNENRGGVVFPNRKGVIDLLAGFASDGPEFMDWCGDLFEHLWARADHISETAVNE